MARTLDQPGAASAPSPGQRQQARLRALNQGALYVAATLAVIVVLWQTAIVVFALKPFVVPTPVSVLEALVGEWPKLGLALGYTLQSTLMGLAVAFTIANLLAALFTLSPRLAQAMMPIVITIRTAPVLAIAPILIMIFGRGQGTSIAVVVIVAFFPIMVNATKGYRSTNANALELMHVLGATWAQTFFRVRIPFALPFVFTGMRTAATSGLLSAMLAEWLSGAPGIGTLILEAGAFRNLPLMWAGVALTMALAFVIFAVTVRIERGLVQ